MKTINTLKKGFIFVLLISMAMFTACDMESSPNEITKEELVAEILSSVIGAVKEKSSGSRSSSAMILIPSCEDGEPLEVMDGLVVCGDYASSELCETESCIDGIINNEFTSMMLEGHSITGTLTNEFALSLKGLVMVIDGTLLISGQYGGNLDILGVKVECNIFKPCTITDGHILYSGGIIPLVQVEEIL